MKLLGVGIMLFVLAGCGDGIGRYQLAVNKDGAWMRIDTRTGEMAACGHEPFATPPKFYCIRFPDTIATK